MVQEILHTGARNAQTASALADILHCKTRDISKMVEIERRKGAPICASCGSRPGYYLAETPEELESYCKALYVRAGRIFRTRRGLLKALEKMKS